MPTRAEILEIVKRLPTNTQLTQDQLFQLTFIFYVLITPTNLTTPAQIFTFSMITRNEFIRLLQESYRLPYLRNYFFEREDSVEKKASCISGLMQAMSQVIGGVGNLAFMAGSLIPILIGLGKIPLSVIPGSPLCFTGGESSASLSALMAIPSVQKKERCSGNPRLSLSVEIVRRIGFVVPGIVLGLVFPTLGYELPYSIGPISLGIASAAQCVKMVLNGVLYGERPTQGFVNKLKLVIENVSKQQKAALAVMFLTITKSLTIQDNPYALYFGAAALACTTSIAGVADSLSHVELNKLWTRDNASNAIAAVESALFTVINGMAMTDIVAGTDMVSPEVYTLVMAAGLTVEQVSNILTTQIGAKAKPYVTTSGLLAVLMFIIKGLSSADTTALGIATLFSMLFYFFIVLPMIQPGAPAQPVTDPIRKPLLGVNASLED